MWIISVRSSKDSFPHSVLLREPYKNSKTEENEFG